MTEPLAITLDRAAKLSLSDQIHAAIRDAVLEGRLPAGTRLPSWRDLAAQLGVARGTVRVAYERLSDEQLAVGRGAAGTHVVARSPLLPDRPAQAEPLLPDLFHAWSQAPLPFQSGVPAQDAFPFKLWSRLVTRAARGLAAAPVSYPDPRGDPELRREIAGYLGIARGLRCTPAQVIITGGFAGALNLTIQGLRLAGRQAWMEEPGFYLTRAALGLAGMSVEPVPVDGEGLDVAAGIRRAPGAALAVVTAGQQAPLGVALSLVRRQALLAWAREAGAWILEDDYLSELQLRGRAAPALASLDAAGRVFHAGSFSKTISPALRLGFLVVPPDQVGHFGEVAACLVPAPAGATQRAVAAFLAEGHYLRHLRRMKRLYAARRDALVAVLRHRLGGSGADLDASGLLVRLALPAASDDIAIVAQARAAGLAPTALSRWYAGRPAPRGLLLGVTNLTEARLEADCAALLRPAQLR